MLKIENYIQIPAWMITGLGLQGNELICYALIFGLCQDGEEKAIRLSWFADWIHIDGRAIQYVLSRLKEKGLINATCVKGKATRYSVNPMALRNGVEKAFQAGRDEEAAKRIDPNATFDTTLKDMVKDTIKELGRKKEVETISPAELKRRQEIRDTLMSPHWPN